MNATDIQTLISSTSATDKAKISQALSFVKNAYDNDGSTAENVQSIQVGHLDINNGLFIFETNTGVIISINYGKIST